MKIKKPAITARQLIRWRNIMLGLPIVHLRIAQIPFGYELDPDKEGWLRPVDKELHALYWAWRLKTRSTKAELARWVTKETGRYVSYQALYEIFRYRPPLATYLLPLNDRFSIATCPTEEKAIELQPNHVGWGYRKNVAQRNAYNRARDAAVKLREQANRAKRQENPVSTESRPPNGVSGGK